MEPIPAEEYSKYTKEQKEAIWKEEQRLIKEKELPINPGYLISKDFLELSTLTEDQISDIGAWDLEAYTEGFMYENSRVFVQKELHRYQFAVIWTETNQYIKHDDVTILVKNDIGCGWIVLPDGNFSEWPQKYFEMLYEGIRRQKL